MFRILLVGLVGIGAAVTAAVAAPPADPYAAADVQDLLFLAPDRPILLRLHLLSDAKPAADRWSAYMDRLFAFFDRDGDGVLDKEEAARVLTPVQVQGLFRGNFILIRDPQTPSPADLDRDEDGKVSRAEFFAYYQRHDAGPVQVSGSFFNPVASDPLSEALFALLDTDHDGRLSAAELVAAPKVLAPLDTDDDELVTAQEILTAGPPPGPPPIPTERLPGRLLLVPKEDGPGRLARRMEIAKSVVVRYDRDGDGKLDPAEFPLPREQFDRLDTNGDGKLEVLELLRWVVARPDAEAVLGLSPPESQSLVATVRPVTKDGPWRRDTEHILALSAGSLAIRLIAVPAIPSPRNPFNGRQRYAEQFHTVDVEDRGYVTRKQIEAKNDRLLQFALELGDRNEDGKLTRAELDVYLDLLAAAEGARTRIDLLPGGRGLFSLLDADRDGQLSVRELRGAATRLAPLARSGGVSLRKMPTQIHIVVSQGTPAYRLVPTLGFFAPAGLPRPPRGPLWFRKMDRNGDGDVSPREFLGSRAAFDRLDLDKDGLISVEEAEQADWALRKARR
jgi:Ca2+-binding EF-hand superfamily protein